MFISCDNHFSYFCKTCPGTICRECIVTSHQNNQHEFALIEQAISSQKNEIASYIQVDDQKLPMLNRASLQLYEIQTKLDTKADLIKSEILERTPKLVKALEEREKQLLEDLHHIVKEKREVLKKQYQALENETASLENLQRFSGKYV